jgi:hypothetical protein
MIGPSEVTVRTDQLALVDLFQDAGPTGLALVQGGNVVGFVPKVVPLHDVVGVGGPAVGTGLHIFERAVPRDLDRSVRTGCLVGGCPDDRIELGELGPGKVALLALTVETATLSLGIEAGQGQVLTTLAARSHSYPEYPLALKEKVLVE